MRSPTSSERLRLEKYRVADGLLYSNKTYGNNGVFVIPSSVSSGWSHQCVISDGLSWDHVSVVMRRHLEERTPTWDECCEVKNLFWTEDECVIQFHPARSNYINVHENCLHLWKPIGVEIPMPPKEMIA